LPFHIYTGVSQEIRRRWYIIPFYVWILHAVYIVKYAQMALIHIYQSEARSLDLGAAFMRGPLFRFCVWRKWICGIV